MVKIFEAYPPSDDYEWLTLVDEIDFDKFQELDERSVADTWTPLKATLIQDEAIGKAGRKKADLPWFLSNALVLRDDAIDALGPVLEPYGELLPLDLRGARLAAFHATNLIDALDEEYSEIVRFDSGRVMSIEKYSFKAGVIRQSEVFVIPQYVSSAIYLTDSIVNEIESLGLSGTAFRYLADVGPKREQFE
jgi:hypothetical protein